MAITLEEALNQAEMYVSEEVWERITKYPIKDFYSDSDVDIDLIRKSIGSLDDNVSTIGENNSQYISFIMDRYFDGVDLVDMLIQVQYELEDGSGSVNGVVNVYKSEEHIRFGWPIPIEMTQNSKIKIMVFCTGTLVDGKNYVLKTKPILYTVYDTLEIGGTIVKPDDNWYLQFVNEMDEKVNTAVGASNFALEYMNIALQSSEEASNSLLKVKEIQEEVYNVRNNVLESESNVNENALSASNSAILAESYAKGGTGTRTGEDTDNAKYYYEKARETDVWQLSEKVNELEIKTDVVNNADVDTHNITDSADALIKNLKIYGKSEQKQYSGKNLAKTVKEKWDWGKNELSVGDNCLTIGYIGSRTTYCVNVTEGETYIFGYDTTESKLKYLSWATSSEDDLCIRSGYKYGENIATVTIQSGETKLYIHVLSSTIRANKGEELFDFEPYVGGIPSPNPDYPQEIKSVVNPVVKVCGKNLAKVRLGSEVKDEKGYYNTKNVWNANRSIGISSPLIKKGNTITLSCIGYSINNEPIIPLLFYDDGTYDSLLFNDEYSVEKGLKLTKKLEKNLTSARIGGNNNVYNVFIKKDSILLELGSTATEYEPYKEQTASLPYTLNAIPVSKGGNVTIDGQQYIADYVDVERKKLVQCTYLADNLKVESITNTIYLDISSLPKSAYYNAGADITGASCTHLKQKTENELVQKNDGFSVYTYNGNMYIRLYVNGFMDSIETAQSWLDSNKVKILYILETPIEIDLTDEQVQLFKELSTYYPTTNVFVTSNQLDGACEFIYFVGGESGQEIGTLMSKIGQEDISQIGNNVTNAIINMYDESEICASIIDRTYQGTDLTVKFAEEISGYSDEWAWIKGRVTDGNFKGIHVGDYIPITCSNGYVLNAQIAGINTYKGYGDTEIGNHIDFICKELWNDLHVMNKVNYNNGNANSPSPFLASDLNYWLNSMSGTVPNSTSDPSVTTEVDYTAGGVLYYLPDKLKNQIITKRIVLPSRYTAGQVLTNDNSWAWQSTGKLWIPSEVEVYGAPCWGNSGYGMGGFVQYPLFACNINRAKLRCASKDRYNWWLLSAHDGNSTNFAGVGTYGICYNDYATTTWVAAPVCFRI